MKLLEPPIEQLVREIIAINRAWKEAKEMFEDSASPLANSLRNLKNRLQVRLLRTYAPQLVYLVEDRESESEEPLYGLQLSQPIDSWKDAAHIPVRVAREYLTSIEIQRYLRDR